MRQALTGFGLLALAVLALPGLASAQTVFAAASLAEAMADIDALWQQQGHPHLVVSLASSAALARQIDQGAPANIFASADERWADWLAQRGRLVAGTRQDLLSNSLVLVVPKAQAHAIAIGPGFDLASLLGPSGRLAVGDPASVPAGIYAQQALTSLGAWPAAAPRLARSDSVRSALRLVERGEAPAGIVYATDAAASTEAAVAGVFPPGSHEPIAYPFAIVTGGDTPEARTLLAFMASKPAQAAFTRRGFVVR